MARKSIISKLIWRIVTMVIFLCAPVSSVVLNAQSAIVFANSDTSLSLTNRLDVYIDASALLSVKQAIELYGNRKFKNKLADVGVYSSAAVWLSISVENKTDDDLFLEIYPGILNNVSVYTGKNNVLIDSIEIGSIAPIENKRILSRRIVYVVKPGSHDYFVRVKSDTFLPFSVDLHSKNDYFQKEHIRNIIDGILFGGLILVFLYNLLLYFSVRDIVYLSFSIYVFFGAIIMGYNFGVYNHFSLYPTISYYITVFYSLLLIATILFVISFLELKNTAAHKRFKLIISLLAIIGVVDLTGFHLLANFSVFVFGGVIFLYIFIVAVQEGRKGNRSASLFSIPWALTIFAYAVLLAHRLFPSISINVGFDFIVYSGYLNMLLLSLAVGNKINIYSKEKEDARARELVALRERDSIIGIQKVKLEEIVQERNKELIDKNLALSVQQKEIATQTAAIGLKNKEINYINEQLQLKNKQIETQNMVLEKNRQELEGIVGQRTKELKEAKGKAIVADTLKTSFLNNLSREIKTPMNAITGYTGLLLTKTLSVGQRNEYLQIIIQNVHALLSLIDDIVTLSRIQAGIMKLRFQAFGLITFIGSIADEFKEKLDDSKNKNIKLVTKVPDGLKELTVHFDYNKLWLIYRHLIENAIKYTEKGSVTIGFEIEDDKLGNEQENASGTKKYVKIVFFVKDTGIGISNNDIDKYIVKRDTDINKYQFRQEGVGLAIVTGLIDLFKGGLEVTNTNGTGFYIRLNIELIGAS